MDWNGILGDVISGSILLIIGGIGGWFIGLFKGKKESVAAIERKNEIYQPLLDCLENYSQFDWSILDKIQVEVLTEIVNNSYKYGLDYELQKQCDLIDQLVREYNCINSVRVANSIIIDIFIKGYKEIYGSIVAGECHHSDIYGNEWDEEVLVEPVQVIKQTNYQKEIDSLLRNEGMYSGEVCVDNEYSLYEPIYQQLKIIYSSALNAVINGEKIKKPKPVIELGMLPEEYIAYHYDFFEIYNNDEKIKRKYELREEIIYLSQAVVQALKEKIEKIVRVYEIEEI